MHTRHARVQLCLGKVAGLTFKKSIPYAYAAAPKPMARKPLGQLRTSSAYALATNPYRSIRLSSVDGLHIH